MATPSTEHREQFIRVIIADSQAIFRAGLIKIFAVENDIRIVGQAETLEQTLTAVRKFTAEILIFEAGLARHLVRALQEILKEAPKLRVVVVTETPDREVTLDLFRRGIHSIVSREVDSEFFVDCLRKVAGGEAWLEPHAIQWVLDAYRNQRARPPAPPTKAKLAPKEALIVSCVTQGMTNKEIARQVGTTEQVVKNYLRKIYDKLGVADRLELALFFLNHRTLQDAAQKSVSPSETATPTSASEPATAQSSPGETPDSSKKRS